MSIPLDGRKTAGLWAELNAARGLLDGAGRAGVDLDMDAAVAARDRLLAAEAALDFGDEADQPAATLHPDQRVGVLLPLRLETRFHEAPGGAGSVLRLRIFPEPIAFDQRPRPVPGQSRLLETEGRALEEYRVGAAGAGLDSDQSRAAFRRLASAVGAARAAWLVTHVAAGDPVPAPEPPIAAVPSRLGVWVAQGGGPPTQVAVLDLDAEEIAEQSTAERLVAGGADFDAFWWNSFAEAKRVGLACEIVLARADDIDFLAVVGLGDTPASELFSAHAQSGRLGALEPGTPTNSVDGRATAATELDADGWLELLGRPGWTQAGTRALALCLTGDPAGLPALPGGTVDVRTTAQRAAMLLLPALLGRAFHDEWRLGVDGYAAARWATRWLLPGGQCPTLRLGDIPYGVLPAAPHPDAWIAASDDPPVELPLLRRAQAAARVAGAVSEAAGTMMGASQARVLELLTAAPVSTTWATRSAMSLPVFELSNLGPDAIDDVEAAFDDDARQAVAAGFRPDEPFVETSDARPLPRKRTDRELLRAEPLIEIAHAPWQGADIRRRPRQEYRGEALFARSGDGRHLVELLVHASMALTHARLSSLIAGRDGRIDLLAESALSNLVSPVATPVARDAVARSGPLGAEIVRGWDDARDALEDFLADRTKLPALVDAAFGLLDLSSHRADPWVTGAADRRLRRLAGRGVPFVVGAYGWVDQPRPAALDPRPGPGPTDRGLLHAPGAPHAATAALLRDRACATIDERWDLNLDSGNIRAALRLAGYVRAGITFNEAVGREVERIAGDVELVRALRRQFNGAGGGDRQVCDGDAVLAATAATHPDHGKLAGLGLSAAQLDQIAALTGAIDAYADLLVADATFAFVSGRSSLAAPALDAGAGLAAPPEMRALRTPRRGESVGTLLLGLLPAATLVAEAGPAGIALPELAAALVARFGGAAAWTWARSTPAGFTPISLEDLGLEPSDVLAIEDQTLDALLGQGAALRSTGGRERVAGARRLAAALTGNGSATAELPALDDGRADQLAARAVADLARLTKPVDGDPGAAPLVIAARWGFTITTEAFEAGMAGRQTRQALLGAVVGELAARLERDDAATMALGARLKNLSAPSVPPPPSLVGSPSQLGLGGALRRSDLDRSWLEIVAAVRPEASALEVYQLSPGPGATPLHGFTAGVAPWQPPSAEVNRSTIAYGPAGILSRPKLVGWVLGSWNEVVPAREHQTHAAFGWNAPDSRAPQAVLVAVPPDLERPLSEADIVATVIWTRDLARARTVDPRDLRSHGVAAGVTPINLLHASGPLRVDPSETGTAAAVAGLMTYERVEPGPSVDTLAGLQAPIGDPLWLLGRQWQLGEHRGEDASSPVELECEASAVSLESTDLPLGRPGGPTGSVDPTSVPVEALIEADPSSWWTMGRRVRLGQEAKSRLDALGVGPRREAVCFGPLPPPYTELAGAPDGRAVFQSGMLAGDPIWAEVPLTPPDHWRSDRLDHTATFRAGRGLLRVDGHDGGEVDWWSADATGIPAVEHTVRSVVPGRLRYPGAAQPRYWQLENADHDPAGFPPDAARWATALWSDLVTSAGGDWFTAPVPGPATGAGIGSILTLHGGRVRDSFDDWWPLAFPATAGDPPGPARPWSLYRTRGLSAGALVLWPSTLAPLGSAPLDEVILGVDEDADLCWAVELRVDGATLDPGSSAPPPRKEAGHYLALPSWGLPAHGHPYRIENRGPEGRLFVQGLVADLSGPVARLRGGPRTSMLGGGPQAGRGHELQPSAVPSVGVRLVRRWCLARATDGQPVLWLQRERSPLPTGPVSHLRFDVAVPDPEADHG